MGGGAEKNFFEKKVGQKKLEKKNVRLSGGG